MGSFLLQYQVIGSHPHHRSPVGDPIDAGDQGDLLSVLRLQEAIPQGAATAGGGRRGLLLGLERLVEVLPETAGETDEIGMAERIQ